MPISRNKFELSTRIALVLSQNIIDTISHIERPFKALFCGKIYANFGGKTLLTVMVSKPLLTVPYSPLRLTTRVKTAQLVQELNLQISVYISSSMPENTG